MKTNDLYEGYVVNPTWELTPQIFISPFSASEMSCMDKSSVNNMAVGEKYLNERFVNYKFSLKGRFAIQEVLEHYSLDSEDVVTILTTSGNKYISSCVTNAIEKICKWSRVIEPRTKLLFVNHEFGYLFPKMKEIADLGIPIVEDCAHSFFSLGNCAEVGKYSDFVIYSLPKAFPMQLGAVITSKKYSLNHESGSELGKYILKNISEFAPFVDMCIEKRLRVYDFYEKELRSLGITPFFKLEEGIVPGVFLFKWNENIDYPMLKDFMQGNGVESSVFYGKSAFYVPCHQNLDNNQCEYIVSLLKYFYEKSN